MSTPTSTMTREDRESLERRADAIREKLMHTIDALDQRRHEAFDLRLQVRRHVATAAILGGAVALGIGGTTLALVWRFQHERTRLRRDRWRALVRSFRHPERIAREESVGTSIIKRVLGGVLTATAVQLARRVVDRLLFGAPETSVGSTRHMLRMR